MPCSWGVKAGVVRVWVPGKTVWFRFYTLAISERFKDIAIELIYKVLYKFSCLLFTYTPNLPALRVRDEPWMSEMDLPSPQFHVSLGVADHISHFFAPVTLWWPLYTNLTWPFWRCTQVPKTNFLGRGIQMLWYYIHTGATENIFHADSRVVNNNNGRHIMILPFYCV